MALVARLVGQNVEQTMLTLEELLEPEIFAKGVKQGFEQGVKKGVEQGVEQGVKQGVKKGVVKGQREFLLRQLVRRFGTLPRSVNRRVAGASTEELERWGERILDATSLDDVFAAP